MKRVRFFANYDDPRPLNWPITHPYWISGYHADGSGSIIVAYAPDDHEDYIFTNWPEATNIDVMQEGCHTYIFTDRFPRPSWFEERT